MRYLWKATVLAVIPIRSPVSCMVCPVANNCSTSNCRTVNGAWALGSLAAHRDLLRHDLVGTAVGPVIALRMARNNSEAGEVLVTTSAAPIRSASRSTCGSTSAAMKIVAIQG